jgi:hypothetical protein
MNVGISLLNASPIIFSYTREQAIDDGVLVDLRVGNMGPLVAAAGIRIPLACTSEVFWECIHDNREEVKLNRLWDVLFALHAAARGCKGSEAHFYVDSTELKVIVGPGDHGEPVMTVMLANQD